jgi:hypothetical protein
MDAVAIILEVAENLCSLEDLVAFAKLTPLHARVINEYKSGIAMNILANNGISCSVFRSVIELKKVFKCKKRMDLKNYDTTDVLPENWIKVWLDLHMFQHNYYWVISEGRPDLAKIIFPGVKKKSRYLMHVARVFGAYPHVNTSGFTFFFDRHPAYRFETLDLHVFSFTTRQGPSFILDHFIKHDMYTVNRVLYHLFFQRGTDENFLLQLTSYITSGDGKLEPEVLIVGLRAAQRDMHWRFMSLIARLLSTIPNDVRDYFEREQT